MTELTFASRLKTSQGLALPRLGFGVFQVAPGTVTRTAVATALRVGYRLIDTAAMYGNEADVGEAVRASGVPREEIVVTTKLWHTEHGFDAALAAGRKSHERLGLGPIDLYLIHWPKADSPQQRLDSWRALERLQRDGVVRTIGVSNYAVRHLEELAAAAEIRPSVNQVEAHPFVYDPELLGYCDRHGVTVEAYSPLTRSRRLDDPRLTAVAHAKRRTPAQVLLRWGLQHGLVELPRSVREERIRENSSVFDFALSPSEMTALDSLRDGARVTAWDPAAIP